MSTTKRALTTYSYKQKWFGWVKQHALNEAFGFPEGALGRNKGMNSLNYGPMSSRESIAGRQQL